MNIQSSVLWLCWISVGVRVTEAQSNDGINGGVLGDGGQFGDGDTNGGELSTDNSSGGGFDGAEHNGGSNGENDSRGSDNNNNGGRGFGHRNKNVSDEMNTFEDYAYISQGFRNGNRFRKGGGDNQQQDNGQTAIDGQNEGDVNDKSEQNSLSTFVLPNSTPTITPALSLSLTVDPSILSSEAAISPVVSSDTGSFIAQPTSVADVFPQPQSTSQTIVGIPYVLPPSSTITDHLSSFFAPEPTSIPPSVLPLTTSRLTITTSMTVYVTDSSLPIPTSVFAEEDTSAPAQATQASSLDLAPLPTSSVQPLSTGGKAGMGIGITLALLLIGGAIVYGVYRRRKNKLGERLDSETGSQAVPRRSLALTGFFRSKVNRESKNDPEWRIESASKVSMVRAGSVKSVGSHTRSISPPLPIFLPSEQTLHNRNDVEMELVKVGMEVPDRKPPMGLASMALRSNPPVSPSAFPSPPGAEKPGSWPLST